MPVRILFVLAIAALVACDATKTAEQCVAADLIGQCPAGSNPILGAAASSSCDGTFEGQTIGSGMAVEGQCGSNGTCEFLCQFEVPCTCGVATLTKESIVCAECPEQSCGDGRCEGTEREVCAGGEAGCQPCAEDCGGSTCGDGDCTGDESPTTCPQDCENFCTPSARTCIGNKVSVCAADGQTSAEVDCSIGNQVCANGNCVAPNVCGNGVCEAGEDGVCLADCERVCDPGSRTCNGMTLVVCAVDGEDKSETDCAAAGQLCANGECRPADVCGNGVCEAGEEECAADCMAVCGNGRCENNEATTCPRDCTVCGDGTCGAGEIEGCPQDCGICVPSEKTCIATTLRVCNANGTAYDDVDCAGLGLSCALGNCVEKDVCGNGVCEAIETEASCERDCAEVCGDGRCGGTEAFETCALDCDPVCGDATCEGDETNEECAFDCLVTCGDGTCGGLEDRDNCPRDCGFCGDGTCQDGAESASLTPPAGQESCVVDCVITQCGRDSDCDDKVGCTRNLCLNGSCIYTPDDAACGASDESCIAFHGCCADGDGDGYADVACGGSDCDDDDRDVHPGALEQCGGGDKNCNGVHRPALAPPKKLTATASTKRGLKAFVADGEVVVTWTGKAAVYEQLELLTASWGLVPDGAVKTVPEVRVHARYPSVEMAWHPGKHALGAMWVVHQDGDAPYGAKSGWIGLDGEVVGELTDQPVQSCVINSVPYPHSPIPFGAVVQGDGVLFSTRMIFESFAGGYASGAADGGWTQMALTGNLTTRWGAVCGASETPGNLVALGDFVSGMSPGGPRIITIDTTAPGSPQVVAAIAHGSAANGCLLGEDGALLTAACADASGLWYHRVTQAGAAFYSEQVQAGTFTPFGIGKSAPRGSDAAQVGVVTRDAGNNLWFFVRDAEGEAVLEPAIVAGGETSGQASVLHDGNDFVLVWLAKVQGFEQAFAQRVTCE